MSSGERTVCKLEELDENSRLGVLDSHTRKDQRDEAYVTRHRRVRLVFGRHGSSLLPIRTSYWIK